MVDPVFGVNEFGKPRMLTETQTYVNNFLTLLLGKPGFFPSLPDIGIDIAQYLYMHLDDINVETLKSKIATQCADFIPLIVDGRFDIVKTNLYNRTVLIFILPEIDDTNDLAVSIGVTTNNNGEVIYKFVENKYQIV